MLQRNLKRLLKVARSPRRGDQIISVVGRKYSVNIREKIVTRRRNDIERSGYSLGSRVPAVRNVPLVGLGEDRFIITEIKRKSPSKGDIAPSLDAKKQAERYYKNGARCFSVLTEGNYFGGNLDDLMAVKQAFPGCFVLRKDFLVEPEDIRVSYRAGADAVLLIAGIVSAEKLKLLYEEAMRFHMVPLVELHDITDMRKAETIKPIVTGINSRNLATFSVDLIAPLTLQHKITWPTTMIFESGIIHREDAAFAFACGFHGLLVGESVVTGPERIRGFLAEAAGFSQSKSVAGADTIGSGRFFWRRLYGRAAEKLARSQSLLKICGITNERDMIRADEIGADCIGFILAPSPREVTSNFIERLPETEALKVGVYAGEPDETRLPGPITELLSAGKLDCIQFHGNELPEQCSRLAFPYYKAVRIHERNSAGVVSHFRSPRVLVDKPRKARTGENGSGPLPKEIIGELLRQRPLWLAGGLDPGNIEEIVSRYKPELIDVSSGIESAPGKKDHHLMKTFCEKGGLL